MLSTKNYKEKYLKYKKKYTTTKSLLMGGAKLNFIKLKSIIDEFDNITSNIISDYREKKFVFNHLYCREIYNLFIVELTKSESVINNLNHNYTVSDYNKEFIEDLIINNLIKKLKKTIHNIIDAINDDINDNNNNNNNDQKQILIKYIHEYNELSNMLLK